LRYKMGQPTTAISGFGETTSGDFRSRLLTGVREWASNAVNYDAQNMFLLAAEWDGARWAVSGHDGQPFASLDEILEKGLKFLGTNRTNGALNGAGLKLAASRLSFPDTNLIVGSRIGDKFYAGRGCYDPTNSMWEVVECSELWLGRLRTLFGKSFDTFTVFYAMQVVGSGNLFPVKMLGDLPFMCDFIGRPGRDGVQRGGPLTLRYHTYKDIPAGKTHNPKGSFGKTTLSPREEYYERFRGDNMKWVVASQPFDFEVHPGLTIRVEQAKITIQGFPTESQDSPSGEHHLHSIRPGKEFKFDKGSAACGVLGYKARGFASFVAGVGDNTARFLDNTVYTTRRPSHFFSSLGLPSTEGGPSGPFITVDVDIQKVARLENGQVIEVLPFTIATALGYRPDFTFGSRDITRKLLLAACEHVAAEDLADAQKELRAIMPSPTLDDLPDLGGGGPGPGPKTCPPVLEAWDVMQGCKLSDPDTGYMSGDEILAFVWNLEHNRPARPDEVHATARCSASVEINHLSSRTIGLIPGAESGLMEILDALETRGLPSVDRTDVPLVSLKISQMAVLNEGARIPIDRTEYMVGNPLHVPVKAIDVVVTGGRQRLLVVVNIPSRRGEGSGRRGGGGGGGAEFKPFKKRPPGIIGTLDRGESAHLFLNPDDTWVTRVFRPTANKTALEHMRILWEHMNRLAIGLRDAKMHDATPPFDDMPPEFQDYLDFAINQQLRRIVAEDKLVEELVEKIERAVDREACIA